MKNEQILKEYQRWLINATKDKDLISELKRIEGNDAEIEDAFYRDLAFGTGGLRGVIGAGTNRMNVYTVAKASQGLANFVIKKFPKGKRRIAVSFDSRIKSALFSKTAAGVFAANGIEVHIFSELMPTPCLSYAVRALDCAAGIMITASHNPARYNGYKVYGADGCQITTEAAEIILAEIEKLDVFCGVKELTFEEGQECGLIRYIDDDVYTEFIEEVKSQSLLKKDDFINKNTSIVYTPLNGTGLKPVLRVLRESGYTNITVVREQEEPNGNFPTCPYPNPEIREAMKLGMEYAEKNNSDLLLATDPDCDRVGIAVRDKLGRMTLLSGNETGILLLDYICARRTENGTMPQNPVTVKTIVTADLAERVALNYGVKTINVLTGFKFIGEQIGRLEAKGRTDDYIFGFEESYGYLSGSYVRDKDAVDGAFLICEMFAYYATRGISLLDKLEELYEKYGYSLNTLYSFEFDGAVGYEKMQTVMSLFRGGIERFKESNVVETLDYLKGIDSLPKSDVIKFKLNNNCSVVVRPSGTEPKLKVYLSVSAEGENQAREKEKQLFSLVTEMIENNA